MAVETKKQIQAGKKLYFYQRCLPCDVKLHISAYECWKCGKRPEPHIAYGSENPNDAIYSLRLNSIKKCLDCYNTQRGNTCKYIICFGSVPGQKTETVRRNTDCEACNRFHSIRFECCQQLQKEVSGAVLTPMQTERG